MCMSMAFESDESGTTNMAGPCVTLLALQKHTIGRLCSVVL